MTSIYNFTPASKRVHTCTDASLPKQNPVDPFLSIFIVVKGNS